MAKFKPKSNLKGGRKKKSSGKKKGTNNPKSNAWRAYTGAGSNFTIPD